MYLAFYIQLEGFPMNKPIKPKYNSCTINIMNIVYYFI